jgi:hypothetical protein
MNKAEKYYKKMEDAGYVYDYIGDNKVFKSPPVRPFSNNLLDQLLICIRRLINLLIS